MPRDPSISRRIVFIIGAGCSVPYGFPSGPQLVQQLQRGSLAEEDLHGLSTKERACRESEDRQFSLGLLRSKIDSIDEYLRANSQSAAITNWGRLAIARCILKAEREAKEVVDEESWGSEAKRNGDWLRVLWNRIKAPPDVFVRHQIAFVVLNYDRLLEYYLISAMQHSYGITWPEAMAAIERIPILHVHGLVGALGPRSGRGHGLHDDVVEVGFGTNPGVRALEPVIQHFRLWWEPEDEGATYHEASRVLAACETLVVLGVGQAAPTLRKLVRLTEQPRPIVHDVWATAYGLHGQERHDICSLIGNPQRVSDASVDACKFLRQLLPWHTIAGI